MDGQKQRCTLMFTHPLPQPSKAVPPRSLFQRSAFKEIWIKELDVFNKEFSPGSCTKA